MYYNGFIVIGKSDQSAAGAAYDSLVNQLLTLMDGLRYWEGRDNTTDESEY